MRARTELGVTLIIARVHSTGGQWDPGPIVPVTGTGSACSPHVALDLATLSVHLT
jgi:hypothetical protein